MPDPIRVPAYRLHKASGRARTRHKGRDVYFPGKFQSRESLEAYARFAAGLTDPDSPALPDVGPPGSITIAELILHFAAWAERYYVNDGVPTGEATTCKYACRPLEDLFGLLPAAEFGPKKLKLVREEMIRRRWTRRHVNASVNRIKRLFRWGASEELIPGSIAMNVATLPALKRGRHDVAEKPEVAAVPDWMVEKTLAHLGPKFRDLVRVMRWTGMRPGEAVAMRAEHLDRSDPECWTYRPSTHKTRYRGKERVVFIGPRAREVVLPRLVATGRGVIFPTRRDNLRSAVVRACARAGVPVWTPNQLRHAFATEVRARLGLEAAQVALGHSEANVTQVYAERDMAKARAAALMVG